MKTFFLGGGGGSGGGARMKQGIGIGVLHSRSSFVLGSTRKGSSEEYDSIRLSESPIPGPGSVNLQDHDYHGYSHWTSLITLNTPITANQDRVLLVLRPSRQHSRPHWRPAIIRSSTPILHRPSSRSSPDDG